MSEKEINRILAKRKRDLDKEFKTNFQNVRKRIRRIKPLSKNDKTIIIADLREVNGDLMDVFMIDEPWKDVSDYLDTINAYLRSEMDSFDYNGILLVYMPGKMKELMQIITNQHNIIDQKSKLRKIIGLDE